MLIARGAGVNGAGVNGAGVKMDHCLAVKADPTLGHAQGAVSPRRSVPA